MTRFFNTSGSFSLTNSGIMSSENEIGHLKLTANSDWVTISLRLVPIESNVFKGVAI